MKIEIFVIKGDVIYKLRDAGRKNRFMYWYLNANNHRDFAKRRFVTIHRGSFCWTEF